MKPKKKAKRRVVARGLLNWPPSRGPKPAWMTAAPKIVIPAFEIVKVEWLPGRDRHGSVKLASEIEVVPVEPDPSPSKKDRALRKRGIYSMANIRAAHDAEREVSLALNVHVATAATLRPAQWDLVGGAEYVPGARAKAGRGRIFGRKAHATMTTRLPTRSMTFDLSYPLSAVARVTVHPYLHAYTTGPGIRRRSEYKRMSVGYVLWQLARAYKAIYRKHRAYGVWGHAIGDLVFERFTLKDNVGHVSIGS